MPLCRQCDSAPCADAKNCVYDFRVHSEFYICAREVKYDTGYLTVTDNETYNGYLGNTLSHRADPNYGRYFNTIGEEQEGEFNCVFIPDEAGYEVMFIWSGDAVIKKGEELLIDYGESFKV